MNDYVYVDKVYHVEVDGKIIVVVEQEENFVFYLQNEESEPIGVVSKNYSTSIVMSGEDSKVTSMIVLINNEEAYANLVYSTEIKLPVIEASDLFYDVVTRGVVIEGE